MGSFCDGEGKCQARGDGGSGEVCGNGEDNDGDGLVDCADPDCYPDPVCTDRELACDNERDDDDDGATDCDDSDCAENAACGASCGATTPGDGSRGAACASDDDCSSNRCCTSVPDDCNNPDNLCTCRDSE